MKEKARKDRERRVGRRSVFRLQLPADQLAEVRRIAANTAEYIHELRRHGISEQDELSPAITGFVWERAHEEKEKRDKKQEPNVLAL